MSVPAPALEHGADALLVFVDAASARLIPLGASGAASEVRLESDVDGHHRQGGWALLAQSRYQRHLQQQRERHFEAVAVAVTHLGGGAVRHLVLAGETRNVGLFRRHLPPGLAARVVGDIRATRHEAAGVLAERAAAMVARASRQAARADIDAVLDDAASGRHAAAGLTAALEAVARGAVQTLYLLGACRTVGVVCRHCGVMQVGMKPACVLCGRAVRPVELRQAMREEVVAAGGEVRFVTDHSDLARYDGVAARLRFPL